MGGPQQKILVETSAVLPAIGFSNSAHNAHFQSSVAQGGLYTSIYVRMETIRKWVCEAIEFAELVKAGKVICSNCKTIGDQIIAMEQASGMTMLHVDRSYDKLCACTNRQHVKLRSAASFRPPPPEAAPVAPTST